jgi:hypothetical protein
MVEKRIILKSDIIREFHVKDCNGYILGFAERLNMPQEDN